MKKAILLLGILALSQSNICKAQSASVANNNYIAQQEIAYLQQARELSLQQLGDPLFTKSFLANTNQNINYMSLLSTARYYVEMAQFNLTFPISMNSYIGNTTDVIRSNPALFKMMQQLYKQLPKTVYAQNSNWFNMQNVYSFPTEYDYFPGYGYTILMGFCPNTTCASYVLLGYNPSNNQGFGVTRIYGYPPQTYLLNITTQQQMAIVLTAAAYRYVVNTLGSFNEWLAAHPQIQTNNVIPQKSSASSIPIQPITPRPLHFDPQNPPLLLTKNPHARNQTQTKDESLGDKKK